jgi:hypothetical protein
MSEEVKDLIENTRKMIKSTTKPLREILQTSEVRPINLLRKFIGERPRLVKNVPIRILRSRGEEK